MPETSANANLSVQFEQTPLFNESNIMPGDTINRWVKATNNRGYDMPIATKAVNISDPDNLGSKLSLNIKQGINTLYTGTLAEFLAAGEVYLSNLANGAQTQYDFEVNFDPLTDNPYQTKRVGFDIQIGFQGDLPIPRPGQTLGAGAGGGTNLVIYEETILNSGDTFATITWKTKVGSTDIPYPASSQVIYSATGESHIFDFNDAPLYGYAHATPETDTSSKVVNHSVTIYGLTPGTTYFFRCVSRGSLAISQELNFTTTGVAGATTLPEGVSGGAESSGVLGEETEAALQGAIPAEVKGLMTSVENIFRIISVWLYSLS